MPNPILLSALLDLSVLAAGQAKQPEPCVLRATHGTPLLLGDVVEQKLSLTETGTCTSLPTGALLLVNSADNTRQAAVKLGAATGTTRDLAVVAPVPAPRDGDASIAGIWHIFADAKAMSGGEKPLAQVMLTPLAVAVTTTTTTVYDEHPALTEAVAIHAKPPGVAYVLPANLKKGITNVASLALPTLPAVTTWKASTTDATLIVGGTDCKVDCTIESPRSLRFRADRPSPLPLLVHLEAARPNNETFTLSARLAESAAHSSIPLNIADTAYLLCQKHVKKGTDDEIRVNNLAAITNSAVTNNLCKLVIAREEIDRAIALQNNILYKTYACKKKNKGADAKLVTDGEAHCQLLGGAAGEKVTIFEPADRVKIDAMKPLYGRQRVTYFVYADKDKRDASKRTFTFSSELDRRREVAIDFGDETPSPDRPIHVELYVQPETAGAELPEDLVQLPERCFSATLRPKGPFGITHVPNTLGSRSVRIFVTIPVDFAVVRFPAAGLDIKSTRDSTHAQLATLTTGALLTFEPWDYTRATNMYAVPMRFQTGLLMSNWYKGVFHPSVYLGYAITLPVFRGTSQLDSDLALGFGWEIDLRGGYERFEHRSHFLITLGMNILSLFGPQSAPRGGK